MIEKTRKTIMFLCPIIAMIMCLYPPEGSKDLMLGTITNGGLVFADRYLFLFDDATRVIAWNKLTCQLLAVFFLWLTCYFPCRKK